MRVLVQRVTEASVTVQGRVVGEIGHGLLLLVAVGHDDGDAQLSWMADKVTTLRIFADDEGKMNRSLHDVGGDILSVSQFTLYGDCRKGRRPALTNAAAPDVGRRLYEAFNDHLVRRGMVVQTGIFGADMQVSLVNDGPVTFWLDR